MEIIEKIKATIITLLIFLLMHVPAFIRVGMRAVHSHYQQQQCPQYGGQCWKGNQEPQLGLQQRERRWNYEEPDYQND